MLTLKLYH